MFAFNTASSICNALSLDIILNFGFSLILYGTFVGIFLWCFPWVAGLSREEIHNHFLQLVRVFKYGDRK